METVNFNYYGKQYTLDDHTCVAYINDENHPIEGLEVQDLLVLLKNNSNDFEVEYFETACESCENDKTMKTKVFPFLEYHFYVFSKEGKYIQSSLSPDYETMSYDLLEKQGKVDAMYLVSFIVCKECGEYSIEVELIQE